MRTLGDGLPAGKKRFLENSLTKLQSGSVADTILQEKIGGIIMKMIGPKD